MRIGIFTDTYPPLINGVSTSVLMLKRALEKKGHDVYIVTINNENISYKYEENDKIIRIPGIPIGLYDYRLSGIYPVGAIKRIKKWNLDIIHCHTEFSIGTFARIISKQYNIPLVHTYHTMYEDYIFYVTKGYFNGVSSRLVKYFTLFYCDQTISELVVPTRKTYDLFKKKYKVKRSIYIVPTGVDIEKFQKENYSKKEILDLKKKIGLNNDDFILLFVGRISSEKNINFLIDAQKIISKKYSKIKLLIIGDGPDINKLKKQANHKDCRNNVIWLGKVPFDMMPLYYQLADISVTASKAETQGLTVIESLASSVPVVCIADESYDDTVNDGENGFKFKTKRQYRNIIFDLYENQDKLLKLSKEARKSSYEHSSARYAERMLEVYKVAIKNFKGKKPSLFDRIKKVVGLK